MQKVSKQKMQRLLRKLRAKADELEEWLDEDRTITPAEFSKWGQGWYDN